MTTAEDLGAEPITLTVEMEPCPAGHKQFDLRKIDWQLKVRCCWTCGRPVHVVRVISPEEGER